MGTYRSKEGTMGIHQKTGSGRRRWTSKQRQGLLARFHESQLTPNDFATCGTVYKTVYKKG